MNGRRLISYILAMTLFAAPAFGQIIPRSGGGGGGGGGGGDASAANQTTQIGALPLEDALHVSGDRGSFSLGVENDDQAILSTGDKAYTPFGVTARGQVINIPMLTTSIPDTNQLGKQDSSAHINTDVGVPAMSLANEGQTQLSTSDNQYQMTAADREGNQSVVLLNSLAPYAAGRQVSHLEDVAHGSGDAGIPSWGVIHTGLGTVGAIGDYSQFSTDLAGRQYNIPMVTPNTAITSQLGKREDALHVSTDAGVAALFKNQASFSVDAGDGDYDVPVVSTGGRIITVPSFDSSVTDRVAQIEDFPHGGSSAGFTVHQVRQDTPQSGGGVSASGDFMTFQGDDMGRLWTHNDPVDAQLDLQVAASATGNGTQIDVSGVNLILVHSTTDGAWDRAATLSLEAFMGGGISEPRLMPHVAFQAGGGISNPIGRRLNAPTLNANTNTHEGYLVDVRGFQGFRARLTVTGGTAGTVSVHAHLVKNGEGIQNNALALVPVTTGLTAMPDWGVIIAGASPAPASNSARRMPVSRANTDVYSDQDGGFPAHGINNEDLSALVSVEGRYSPYIVDDEGRQIIILSHNEGIASSQRATHLEDNGHTTGDAGVFALAMRNSTPTPTATTALNLDYSPIGVSNLTQVLTVLHHNSAYLGTINISKQEDVGHATTDAGIPAWAVRNDNLGLTFSGATGDYTPQAVTRHGASIGIPFFGINESASLQLGDQEDIASASGDGGMKVFTVRDDVLEADAATSADGDFTWLRVDNRGGLWLAHSGAAFFAITDTGIAAVSQNFSFGFTSKKVRISAPSSNTVGVCVDHIGGTAICPTADTAGDDVLEPGEEIVLNEHAITSVSAIAVSGTQTIVVRAFN